MSSSTAGVSPSMSDARPDPRSRHHPQHQHHNKPKADESTRIEGHGIGQGQNQQAQQLSPVLHHHPSHPEHRNYIRHLQLQQGANGDQNHLPTSPAPPHTQQQRQYLGYNSPSNRHHQFRQQEVRRVASVERGLGQNKPPASHRMSRMKSFGDRDRERHRADEIGFPASARRDQHQQHSRHGERVGVPLTPRVFDGKEMNGNGYPKRVDSVDRMAQMNHGLPNGAPRGKLGVDGGLKKIGLPSTPSPNSSRPGSSRSRRESGSGLKDGHGAADQEMEGAVSRNGNHNTGHRPPPLVKMPVAFNTISRERGFSASSQPPLSPHLPSPRPSNSAPDLAKAETSSRTHHGYGPDAYYAQKRRDHYNVPQPSSAHQSPHTSFLPEGRPIVDRDSTISSSAASSNAMTVDEAIGMYGSDTDEEDGYYEDTAAVEEQISRFHSENFGNEEINGPVSPYPLQLPQLRENVRSPSPQMRDNLRSSSPTANYSREPKPALPSPPRISEVLADDVVLSPVEEGIVKDDPTDLLPSPTAQEESPLTPPQSPPAVPVPVNPLENCMQPCTMPAYISKEVPPRLPYVSNGVGDPVKDARDRYGFRKQTQYVTLEEYEAWSVGYEETLVRRKKKWEQLMKESGLACTGDEAPVRFPPPSAKIKRYVRKGIPPEWRGKAWFWYAGGQARMSKNPGLYQRLLKEHSSSPDWEIIERDLHRTFPDNIYFKPDATGNPNTHQKKPSKIPETPILQALRRVLVAFSIYVPKVGYCQSLNFVAGMLLLFMEEEKAFWMLYIITHQHLPGTHEVNLEGSTADQGVFMMSVRESLPGVWSKIAGGLDGNMDSNPKDLPPVTLCTTAWFMSGFIGSLPVESVLRVWDSWFYEGSKTLFRIALTVLKLGEAEIKGVNDPMEVFQVVQNIPRKLVDAGALLEACFRRRNGFGHLSQQDVDERRKERRAAYASERAKALNPGLRQSKDDAGLRVDFGGHDHDFFKMGGKLTRRMKLKV
ncbi:hypothetical protein L211DRAFT_180027 [Terfezia boudieri ATCC MYA-4762]|uniref:Rab-GAP TBC domain-containing protein n=1 Tax=Terfezia boudieri ATCC MYA-4762 TaxID=1051890 RepID=A0A3N4LP02_9PEZI|nr:hypothetical protein L211DRAFT_180027 [Terfezia boudieri ATCC MYA-4762]